MPEEGFLAKLPLDFLRNVICFMIADILLFKYGRVAGS